eukprot:6200796-Pleurochrysis_carterae.AAC.2
MRRIAREGKGLQELGEPAGWLGGLPMCFIGRQEPRHARSMPPSVSVGCIGSTLTPSSEGPGDCRAWHKPRVADPDRRRGGRRWPPAGHPDQIFQEGRWQARPRRADLSGAERRLGQ